MCLINLVILADEQTPITLGLHIGLTHIYADEGMPPCVLGSIGSAHWSIHPHTDNPRSSNRLYGFGGPHEGINEVRSHLTGEQIPRFLRYP
jgi:hypothetical protein